MAQQIGNGSSNGPATKWTAVIGGCMIASSVATALTQWYWDHDVDRRIQEIIGYRVSPLETRVTGNEIRISSIERDARAIISRDELRQQLRDLEDRLNRELERVRQSLERVGHRGEQP